LSIASFASLSALPASVIASLRLEPDLLSITFYNSLFCVSSFFGASEIASGLVATGGNYILNLT
jgi:hypothetical protein